MFLQENTRLKFEHISNALSIRFLFNFNFDVSALPCVLFCIVKGINKGCDLRVLSTKQFFCLIIRFKIKKILNSLTYIRVNIINFSVFLNNFITTQIRCI